MRARLLTGTVIALAWIAAAGVVGAPAAGGRRGLLILAAHGRTYTRADPFLPSGDGEAAPTGHSLPAGQHRVARRTAHAAGRPRTFAAVLARLKATGAIELGAYQSYSATYGAAQRTLRRLSGTRRTELAGVIANVDAIAAAGQLTPSRLPALMLTLQRNRQWWSTGPLLASGARVGFPASRIVWQYYPGQGIEIQWLGTFGEANGYFLSGHQNTAFKELVDEVLPLASQRAGGLAWEYLFRFDGGAPPWTSGLSQGTALQVLARGWQRTKEPAYLEAAKAALLLFQVPPPNGVRLATALGAHYLQYSYAPGERIINGFIQALIGLYDYTKLTGDPLGAELFNAGDAEARAELPHYNTSAWSRYDQHSESDLHYHELLTEFLQHLCQRTSQGPPLPSEPPAAGGAAGPVSASGARARSSQASTATPIAGDAVYCTTAEEFSEDLHTPPRIELLSHSLRTSSRAGVRFSLSKLAVVKLVIRRGGRVVWVNSATVEGGRPRLLWLTPRRGGSYAITASAVDAAGNTGTTTDTIRLTTARKRR